MVGRLQRDGEREARGPKARTPRAVPVPAAKLAGSTVCAVGLVLLAAMCLWGPRFLPGFWAPHVPALWGLVAGLLIGGGILALYLRFSLGILLMALLAIGASAGIAHVSACRQEQAFSIEPTKQWISYAYLGKVEEDVRFINRGLAATLVGRGFVSVDPAPARAVAGTRCLWLFFRAHADRRFLGIERDFKAFLNWRMDMRRASTAGGLRLFYAQAAAFEWHEAIRERFGPEAARCVARASAELFKDDALRRAFREAANGELPPGLSRGYLGRGAVRIIPADAY